MALKKQKGPKPKQNNFLRAVIILGACVAVALLAFISLELSMLAAGFFIVTGFVTSDIRRRRFWETGLSFRMKGLSDSYKSLERKVTGTRQDVLNIKQQMADINHRIAAQDDILDALTDAPPRPAARKTVLADDGVPRQSTPLRGRHPANTPSMPAATRAGQKPATMPPRGAPDDDYDELSDMVVRELVNNAVKAGSIDIFVQPIVRLPQRRVRYYEIYARIRARPGMYLPARRYMRLAQQNSMANDIDNMLLVECLKTINASAHVERAAPLFVNITAATLTNTIFMKRLLSFLAANRHLAPRLVFEIPLAQYKGLNAAPREILRGLGKLGCSISLDHVDVLEFDIAELQRNHVRFVKISARTLLPYTRSDKTRTKLQREKRKLESNGVSLIVEKVETENDLIELLDFDISYGQGHLFGRPDLEAAYRKRKAA